MFGYVVINKPELKFKEFDVYKGYYCGLCHCLKERYGITGQVTLTYDMTFLSLHFLPVCTSPCYRRTPSLYFSSTGETPDA